MNATSLYVSTCRLVLQANPEDPGCWADLYRLIPYLRQSLSCTVCGNLLIEPYTPTETNCQHHVCRSCKGGKKKLKPSCSWCKNYEKYVENVQLRILLQCYKKLCEYVINSSIYRLMCKTTASGDTNIANMTDLIQEGAGFKDEFKSNSGLSKSAYSILPCIYASASTQTITQAINLSNDSENAVDEDVSVAKSNLSNGSSIYSVTYAGSGNKMVIKRKAMLNKGELENCENLRLIKGSNFKRPIHRRGNFRGRGRGFKIEEKSNGSGINNCTVSSNNVNSAKVSVKKKKLGCRCGNATASPGKLTCCGQRCPCYVDSKACLDCKCRGCRNPHTKEGQKVIREPLDSANSKLQSPAQLQTEDCIPPNTFPGFENLGFMEFDRRRMLLCISKHPENLFIYHEQYDDLLYKNENKCPQQKKNNEKGEKIKGNGNARSDSRVSFHWDKKFCDFDETESCPLKDHKEILITVESIENVDETKVKDVVVKVEFNGNILNQSLQTPIIQNRADIGLVAAIRVEDTNPQFLDEILSNPVLFTVLHSTASIPTLIGTVSTSVSIDRDVKKRASKASNSPFSGSKSYMTNNIVVGICNLDIGSLVTGQKRIKETLLVEPDRKVDPPEVISWVKLPKLIVVVSTGEEPLTPECLWKFNNVIGVTIESVYNVPDHLTEGSFFDAIIPIPSIGDKTKRIKFPFGVVTMVKDFMCKKKWLNLLHIEGRGARSKHIISSSMCEVISTLPENFSLENEINKTRKMIQWNMWKNSLMFKKDVASELCEYLYSYLFNCWPIEITLSNRIKDQIPKDKSAKSDKKSKPAPSGSASSGDHFTAFLNLTPLLYPGVTKIRVAAQLFTYSQSDLISKFGEEFLVSQSQISVATIKTKAPSVRSKASVREPEEIKDSSGAPVFDSEGCPTFIIVEVELMKPFNSKRDFEELEADLKSLVSLKGKMNKKVSNLALAQEIFSQTIEDTVSVLTQEHQNFYSSFQNCQENETEYMDIAFQKFLCKRENFYKARTTLENKVVELVNEKFGVLSQYKERIPEIYVYLVSVMHKITNQCLIGQNVLSSYHLNNDDLQLYAEEAIEEGDYKLAKDYLLLKISRDTSNPNYWLDCAVCCLSLGKYEVAIEAVREALCLDFNHQIALFMYALLMGMINNGAVAEMAFEILLTKYSNFIEGWMALRLFYLIVNNSEGQLVAHQEAKKLECERKFQNSEELPEEDSSENCKTYSYNGNYDPPSEGKHGVASFRNGISLAEPLSWTITFCPPDNINIKTAVLLQKLGFHEYASMSIAQELNSCTEGESLSPFYVYYSCVNFYLQGRYEEAIPVLENFVKEYGKDCFLWSLMGHCYYKLDNHPKAISCYEYVMESYNRPDDIHLVYSRMGFYYIQANKFLCAKRVLKTACKYSPTPKLWKGIGIACLRLVEAEEAEIAFSEANYLDNKDPETWAYLALANAMLQRLDLFKQCYSEAIKRNLKNPDIIKEIKAYALLNGLQGEEFQF